MSRMRRVLVMLTCAVACKGSGADARASISLPGVEESRRFQAEYEHELRTGETTALTAVASHYVARGQTLRIGLDGKTPIVDPPGGSSPVAVFRSDAEGFSCAEGCGNGPVALEELTTIVFGPLIILASPQSGPGRVLVHDPQSDERTDFHGLPWFEASATHIVAATVTRAENDESSRLTTSRGLTKDLSVFGDFKFVLGDGETTLTGYTMEHGDGITDVLIPFVDATTGETTYPVGRYLNVEVPDDAKAIALDFNRATNPLCAHSDHYNCPIPPSGNEVAAAVEAGERYDAH